MVTLIEVMITFHVTITSQEVIVTSPINEQMVEAIEICISLKALRKTSINKMFHGLDDYINACIT